MIDKNDDWKGEGLISAKPRGTSERRSVTASAAIGIHMENLRRKGEGLSRSETTWAKQFRGYWKCGGPRK